MYCPVTPRVRINFLTTLSPFLYAPANINLNSHFNFIENSKYEQLDGNSKFGSNGYKDISNRQNCLLLLTLLGINIHIKLLSPRMMAWYIFT